MNAVRAILACVAILSFTAKAGAASFPVNFDLNTGTSQLTLALTANGNPLGTGKISFASGNLSSTVEQTGTTPPVVSLTSNGGMLDANDFSIPTILGNLSVTNPIITIGSSGPLPNTTASNPGLLDLGGLPISITSGIVKLGASTIADFSTSPASFTVPAGTLGDINETGGPATYDVNLLIPVSVSGSTTADIGVVLTIGYNLAGSLGFAGVKSIPEPGSVVLAAIGLAGLLPWGARRFRKLRAH